MTLGIVAGLFGSACTSERTAPPDRVWGPDLEAARIEARAQEAIPFDVLASAQDRDRILAMSFAEAEARMGPLHVRSQASFHVVRNGHDLRVVESADIWSGPDGSVRVVQKDEDDVVAREGIRLGRQWYVRNGPGALRRADFVQRTELRLEEDAFATLGTLSRMLGPALRLARGPSRATDGRTLVAYEASLGKLRQVEWDGRVLRPAAVRGAVLIDETTRVPVRVNLAIRFTIDQPPGSPADLEDGRLQVQLERRLRPHDPQPFDVDEAVPPLVNPEVDLDPLAFLEGSTKTSTVIGGD
jgi:hypothetical protein